MDHYARSAFGKEVKKKLIDLDKSQSWLIEQIKKRTGLYCDSSYMSKIMTGKKCPRRLIDEICKILEISYTVKEGQVNGRTRDGS